MSPEIQTVVMVIFGALVLAGFRFGVEAVSRERGRPGQADTPAAVSS